MAVYNGEKYIKQAIDSALNQTYADFELLIIDDGSKDRSVQIIETYNDNRIRLLKNDSNMGLFRTRNRGVEEARGEYFATLDCDDIAPVSRLELQLKYFEEHLQCKMCGGRIKYIDSASEVIGKFSPIHGDLDHLKSLSVFTNIFSNSTTMINTAVLRELQYRTGYEPAEDFDLFERLMEKYEVGFLNEFLSYYRVHDANISTLKGDVRKKAEREIIARQLKRYGFIFTEEELALHLNFTTAEFDLNKFKVSDYVAWLKKLQLQNAEKGIFKKRSFNKAVFKQALRLGINKLRKEKNVRPLLATGWLNLGLLLKSI